MEAVQAVPVVREVRIFPIVTHFLNTPVRFFPMQVEREMGSCNVTPSPDKNQAMGSYYTTPSHTKITIETQAIPLPDYARAIDYKEHGIRQMIAKNDDLFRQFYKTEIIPDSIGRLQPTILMAVEMCDMLTAKLHTSRIKDPVVRSKVIEFQLWTMLIFGMIRLGQLRPVHVPKDASIPHQVYDFLALKEYKGRGKFQEKACKELGWHKSKFYKMVDLARKSCSILPESTKKTGKPKKTRADKGSFVHLPEFQQVQEYLRLYPGAKGREIKRATGISFSESTINRWVSYIQTHNNFNFKG